MSEAFVEGQGLLASGDVPGLIRLLRARGNDLPLGEFSVLMEGAGRLAGFGDMERAAAAVTVSQNGHGAPSARELYDFGYACIERGVPHLGVRPLSLALELMPDAAPVLGELVAALEESGQHARAVVVLEEHEPVLEWTHRFQYVYNALMAGSLEKAADGFGRLPEPRDERWVPAREKVRRMLARAAVARGVTSLDFRDLRGWHYTLTGGILGSLSPWGFDAGMTGRWAYVSDSSGACAASLRRLRLLLGAAGVVPETVALLPDRSSRITGLAAAKMLGLPAREFDPDRPAERSIVVAYDLTEAEPGAVAALRERVPWQVLFERTTCWTAPPGAAADVTGMLAQVAVPPWGPRLRRSVDGGTGEQPADDRTEDVIAAELASITPEPDEGDGATPPDPDEELRRFAVAVASASAVEPDGCWLRGFRERVPDAGPVPSSRF